MVKVCLDAGHYGNYNRSPVNSSYYESVRMWKLHELLAEALQARGIAVIKTRSNQKKDLALTSRGKKAKGCDLFISLHSNASNSESVDYPVAIVFQKNDKTTIDERSADIGLRLAKVVENAIGTYQKARISTRASANDRDGNGLKDDEYYGVLQGAKVVGVPALILEHSFHTNKKATEWLLSDTNLCKLAEAEADCIADFLQPKNVNSSASKPSETTVSTPKTKVDSAKSKDKKLARTYTVNASSGLNLRAGAGVNRTILATLPDKTKVTCYGYYTMNGNTKWLYIRVTDSSSKYKNKVGFVSKSYLK